MNRQGFGTFEAQINAGFGGGRDMLGRQGARRRGQINKCAVGPRSGRRVHPCQQKKLRQHALGMADRGIAFLRGLLRLGQARCARHQGKLGAHHRKRRTQLMPGIAGEIAQPVHRRFQSPHEGIDRLDQTADL